MSKATIEGFEAFVNAQPPEATLCHNNWSGCAVGHYANSISEPTRQVTKTLYRLYGTHCPERTTVVYDMPRNPLIRYTEQPSLMDRLDFKDNIGTTYGELQQVIKSL